MNTIMKARLHTGSSQERQPHGARHASASKGMKGPKEVRTKMNLNDSSRPWAMRRAQFSMYEW